MSLKISRDPMSAICCKQLKRPSNGAGGIYMQLLCLGGAGKICREAVLDSVAFADN